MKASLSFDDLPDLAWLKISIVAQITGKCESSVYAFAKAGRMPPIEKIDSVGVSSGMRVGRLKRYLKDPTNYSATNDHWPD